MPAIDATPGGASANSYATLAEADAYHAMRMHATGWTEKSDSEQTVALQMATRLLDQWFEWHGYVASTTQALLWPRSGAYGASGYVLASDTIPIAIRDATAELAMHLLAAETDRTLEPDVEIEGIKSLTAGPVDVEFTGNVRTVTIPESVRMFLHPYGVIRGRSGGSVTMHRA